MDGMDEAGGTTQGEGKPGEVYGEEDVMGISFNSIGVGLPHLP